MKSAAPPTVSASSAAAAAAPPPRPSSTSSLPTADPLTIDTATHAASAAAGGGVRAAALSAPLPKTAGISPHLLSPNLSSPGGVSPNTKIAVAELVDHLKDRVVSAERVDDSAPSPRPSGAKPPPLKLRAAPAVADSAPNPLSPRACPVPPPLEACLPTDPPHTVTLQRQNATVIEPITISTDEDSSPPPSTPPKSIFEDHPPLTAVASLSPPTCSPPPPPPEREEQPPLLPPRRDRKKMTIRVPREEETIKGAIMSLPPSPLSPRVRGSRNPISPRSKNPPARRVLSPQSRQLRKEKDEQSRKMSAPVELIPLPSRRAGALRVDSSESDEDSGDGMLVGKHANLRRIKHESMCSLDEMSDKPVFFGNDYSDDAPSCSSTRSDEPESRRHASFLYKKRPSEGDNSLFFSSSFVSPVSLDDSCFDLHAIHGSGTASMMSSPVQNKSFGYRSELGGSAGSLPKSDCALATRATLKEEAARRKKSSDSSAVLDSLSINNSESPSSSDREHFDTSKATMRKASELMTSLLIRCPFCDLSLSTPEVLVSHLSSNHDHSIIVENSQFADRNSFEIWLNRVEESRQDSSSYISNPDSEENSDSNPEYYLLCAHHSQDAIKRRRVDRNGNFPSPATVLSCPAFVHVRHADDGKVEVAYCLDHVTSLEERRKEGPSSLSRGKKRASSSMAMDCSEPSTIEHTVTPMMASEDIDFSPINEFISTRLDSTAMKLKNLTKVLAQLAVDIGACDHRSQQVLA